MKRCVLLAGLVLVTSSAPVLAQAGGVARVAIKLPRDARLYVDEVFCPLPGTLRIFDTPPLDPDRRYAYTLTVEITHEGKPVRLKKDIVVRANQTTDVDFGNRAAILAAAKKEDAETGEKPAALPSGPPPVQAKATLKEGKILLELPVFKFVDVEEKFPVQQDGMVKEGIRKVRKTIQEVVKHAIPLDKAKAINAAGKAVSEKELSDALKGGGAILVSQTATVDPFYLRPLKNDTLILLVIPGPVAPPSNTPKTPDGEPKKPVGARPEGLPPASAVRGAQPGAPVPATQLQTCMVGLDGKDNVRIRAFLSTPLRVATGYIEVEKSLAPVPLVSTHVGASV